MAPPETRTRTDLPASTTLRSFTLRVVSGPDAGATVESDGARLSVGSADDASLRLTDPYVSRYHAEFEATEDGVQVRDLGSRNGTRVGGLTVRDVSTRGELEVELGRTRLKVVPGSGRMEVPLSVAERFGRLVGSAAPMRAVYATLERA